MCIVKMSNNKFYGGNTMFEKGFFGGLFDFNRDGKLDTFERAAAFGLFCKMMDDHKKDTENKEEQQENKN